MMGTDSKANKKTFSQRLSRDFKLNKYKYLLIIPVLVYLALFCYKPMYGLKMYRLAMMESVTQLVM